MNNFGLYNKFTAVEGKRNALAEMLLEAATSMEELEDCALYVVSLDDANKDTVYVYEVWSDENAHRASLSMEASQLLIQKAKPIIAGVEKINTSSTIGGKGIS